MKLLNSMELCYSDRLVSLSRLKCNKDQAILKDPIQDCQNELMRIKPRLTIYEYGPYLKTAVAVWESAYEYNQQALAKTRVQLIREAG